MVNGSSKAIDHHGKMTLNKCQSDVDEELGTWKSTQAKFRVYSVDFQKKVFAFMHINK